MIKKELETKSRLKNFLIIFVILFIFSFIFKIYVVENNSINFFKTEIEIYNAQIDDKVIKQEKIKSSFLEEYFSFIFKQKEEREVLEKYNITFDYFDKNLKKELENIEEIIYIYENRGDYKNYFKIKDNDRIFNLDYKINNEDLDFKFKNNTLFFNNVNYIKSFKINFQRNFDFKSLSKEDREAFSNGVIIEIQNIDFYDESFDKNNFKIKMFDINSNYFNSPKGLKILIGSDYFKKYMLDFTKKNITQTLKKIKNYFVF